MASEEHQQLAGFIKHVHQTLRFQSQKCGAESAWNTHCNQVDLLSKYAEAMKQLATKYWDTNAADETSKARSRIQWVAARCIDYFFEGGQSSERVKEEKKSKVYHANSEATCPDDKLVGPGVNTCTGINRSTSRVDLLDVGSCYNPFNTIPFFRVIPIDIAPASSDVYYCDFLNVPIVEADDSYQFVGLEEKCIISKLPKNSFDVVVFSLLLEYMPCSEQRYNCCVKAYDLLKPEGLLFIITPDSKNPSANAPLMKSWRIALSYIGFVKVYYEKFPHIHCMAYRKAVYPEIASRLWISETQTKTSRVADPTILMAIPQDSQNYVWEDNSSNVPVVKRTDEQDEQLKEMFLVLPDI